MENALAVLDGAIRNHGRSVSIMTDHGSQFYANASEAKRKGASAFEKSLVRLDIRHILAGVHVGPLIVVSLHEQIHRVADTPTLSLQIRAVCAVSPRASVPACHSSADVLPRWRHACRGLQGQDAPKGATVIDRETGEEYHVRWGGGTIWIPQKTP